MKTYRQFIIEIRSVHPSYGRWGIEKDGVFHHGVEHEWASTHQDLANATIGRPSIVRGRLNVPTRTDWAQEKGHRVERSIDSSWSSDQHEHVNKPRLNIRTHGEESLASTVKHFERFPHVSGRLVHWEHYGKDPHTAVVDSFGSSVYAHNMMKAHLRKIQKQKK